jgi:hypothetical protein
MPLPCAAQAFSIPRCRLLFEVFVYAIMFCVLLTALPLQPLHISTSESVVYLHGFGVLLDEALQLKIGGLTHYKDNLFNVLDLLFVLFVACTFSLRMAETVVEPPLNATLNATLLDPLASELEEVDLLEFSNIAISMVCVVMGLRVLPFMQTLPVIGALVGVIIEMAGMLITFATVMCVMASGE